MEAAAPKRVIPTNVKMLPSGLLQGEGKKWFGFSFQRKGRQPVQPPEGTTKSKDTRKCVGNRAVPPSKNLCFPCRSQIQSLAFPIKSTRQPVTWKTFFWDPRERYCGSQETILTLVDTWSNSVEGSFMFMAEQRVHGCDVLVKDELNILIVSHLPGNNQCFLLSGSLRTLTILPPRIKKTVGTKKNKKHQKPWFPRVLWCRPLVRMSD